MKEKKYKERNDINERKSEYISSFSINITI